MFFIQRIYFRRFAKRLRTNDVFVKNGKGVNSKRIFPRNTNRDIS